MAALKREGIRTVMLTGDHPRVALGAGTDVAIESAGVILVRDRVENVVAALRIGRAASRRMTENVGVAVLFNVVGLGVAAAGLVTPGLAIGWMIASIAAILLNTLRVHRAELRPTAPLATHPAPMP